MAIAFQKATKQRAKLRAALIGPSGSGKTYTGLRLAAELGEKIAVLDTERGSASKYSDEFSFDVAELDSFHPERYIEAIEAAEQAGYDVLLIDSLSHAWMGKDGALQLVDKAAARQQSRSSFSAWREVTPLHNQLVDAILGANLHIIATMRSKQEYVQDKDERGKTVIRKVGLAPVQRDGMEYEFDLVGDLDAGHTLIVTKSRCRAVADAVVKKPGKEFAETLRGWLEDGEPAPEQPAAPDPVPLPIKPERSDGAYINAEQWKALLDLRKSAGYSMKDVMDLVALENQGEKDTKKITQDAYDKVWANLAAAPLFALPDGLR